MLEITWRNGNWPIKDWWQERGEVAPLSTKNINNWQLGRTETDIRLLSKTIVLMMRSVSLEKIFFFLSPLILNVLHSLLTISWAKHEMQGAEFLDKRRGWVKICNGNEVSRIQSVSENNRKPHVKYRLGNDLMYYSIQSFSY